MAKSLSFPPENRLLSLLPRDEFKHLAPQLEPVSLDFKQVLYKARAPIPYAYFPNRGTLSALTIMDNGSAIEVATIGREGMVGLSVLVGANTSPNEVIVQVAGDGLRMEASVLQIEAGRDGTLRKVLNLYLTAFLVQVSQSVACNGLHSIHQRCCRWLLITHDRVDSDVLPLTHEFLAIMLGVRRSSVTEVLGPLRDQGLVRNHRGQIKILDRKKLEAASCECYESVKQEYDRLLG